MNIYIAIITTALVITQIVRLIQNAIQLKKQSRIMRAQLDGLHDITNSDIENQRKMHRLVIEFLEKQEAAHD